MIQHIVVDEDYGIPQSAYEGASILKGKQILDEDDLEGFRQMVGFRNVVGHDYIHLDKAVVYTVLMKGRKDIHKMLSKIIDRFL